MVPQNDSFYLTICSINPVYTTCMSMDYSEFKRAYNSMTKWETSEDDELLEKLSYGGTNNDDEVSKVNHPPHYTSGKQEAINIIEDAIRDAKDPVEGMLQAQVLKYMLRLWLKENPKEDAQKARWYLSRLIEKL